MKEEQKCHICKVVFLEALWCPQRNCPITPQRYPTEQQKQELKIDAPRSAD